MFEKSLYDLIKGLRSHKDAEKEYIESCLRECRQEIRGSDMDLKATALLKLIYLEMFGHDMSWASFNILEVMSAPKYHQKRVGYLGAVQTFGPSTDVLMLATNLLKKDVSSSNVPTISLPLVAIPHLVTPGLANSVVPDLMTRISHSSANVRKKAITTLYRLALVWPEALRPAWPKMKDILENEDEAPEVTATVVNVVCELVWRRPEDFLPLAPRFFDLLVHGGNNWMVIKIIKLFATLTPLEPRLIKKLAPALTNLIRTTPAMSVLYECIHGIIQGGILDGSQGIREGDEIAELCVSKLCGMIAVDGDPNLKYVALLAFNKIVISHPQLVSAQQNVIISCLDDGDISIRSQALKLVSDMVDADTLVTVVEKLVDQLKQSSAPESRSEGQTRAGVESINAGADLRRYQVSLAEHVLEMCSRDMYANISDFDWYIDVLVGLVEIVPPIQNVLDESVMAKSALAVFDFIGLELRNVAIRVKAARLRVTEASSSFISALGQHALIKTAGIGAFSVLHHAAFVVGEYPGLLPNSQDALSAMLLPFDVRPPVNAFCAYIQSILKVASFIFATELTDWNNQKRSTVSLLLARLIHFFELNVLHESIEVQERASTALELMRLADAALLKHESNALTAPTLIGSIIPGLFAGQELNPIASAAQEKVPIPQSLDLEETINQHLADLLGASDGSGRGEDFMPSSTAFYRESEPSQDRVPDFRTVTSQISEVTVNAATNNSGHVVGNEDERKLCDPFYIGEATKPSSGISTPVHEIIQDSNGHDFDIDAIPIMELELGRIALTNQPTSTSSSKPKANKPVIRAEITNDENLGNDDRPTMSTYTAGALHTRRPKSSRPLLGIDSSGLGSLSSSPGDPVNRMNPSAPASSRAPGHDDEMKKALAEVERLRLEMQRAQEKIDLAEDIPEEGTLVTKKKKRKEKKVGNSSKTKPSRKQSVAPHMMNPADDGMLESYQS